MLSVSVDGNFDIVSNAANLNKAKPTCDNTVSGRIIKLEKAR